MNAAATDEAIDPSDELMFLCLGGGNEVGRSCHIIQYKGKTVMVREHEAMVACSECADTSFADSLTLANIPPTTALRRFRSTMISILAL